MAVLFSAKSPQVMNYPVKHRLCVMSLCDIELLQLHVHVVVEGKGSFNLIVQCY